MDHQSLLPSQETIRRFHERALVLYEHPSLPPKQRHRKLSSVRDTSEYPVHEAAPEESMFKEIMTTLLRKAMTSKTIEMGIRRYIDQWTRWVRLGLKDQTLLLSSTHAWLPALHTIWMRQQTKRVH